MYKYVDQKTISGLKKEMQKILTQLTQELRKSHQISAVFMLIGSGKTDLATYDEDTNIYDLDYNLIIQKLPNKYRNDLKNLKEIVRRELDQIAYAYDFKPGEDSTSVITIRQNKYHVDIGILLVNSNQNLCRLIHDKKNNSYILNEISHSFQINQKKKYVNVHGGAAQVKKEYLDAKNKLPDCTSFELYVQILNQAYQKLGGQTMSKVSGNDHTKSQIDHHANQSNPNNAANRAANNNRSNQLNPNNSAYKGSKK